MSSIDDALARLTGSLSFLEAAVRRRVETDAARADRETELALMDEDRARLAMELDAASARLARVTATTGDVGRRVDRAIGAIESVLDRTERADRG